MFSINNTELEFIQSTLSSNMGFYGIAMMVCIIAMIVYKQYTRINDVLLKRTVRSSSVIDFEAIGDGITDDSQAFMKAWETTCASNSTTATLIIPKGKKFLLKPLRFEGPCNSPSINVQVWGDIIAPSKKNFGTNSTTWLVFSKVNGLIVNGNGLIDGNGSSWWSSCLKEKNCKKPAALTFNRCNNLQLSGLEHINSPDNHISITHCDSSNIWNLQITAPETSPNTDGIDISESSNINIHDSYIGTGDDCIAITTGCSNIGITRVNCGPGHGISIGSLGINGGMGTVEEVHVSNCIFNGTQNGARIKTWQGGSGFARKIYFENITLIEAGNPILIDQYYCPHKICKNQTSTVAISNVSFIGFRGTTETEDAIQLKCSKTIGCTDIVLDQINITPESILRDQLFPPRALTPTEDLAI